MVVVLLVVGPRVASGSRDRPEPNLDREAGAAVVVVVVDVVVATEVSWEESVTDVDEEAVLSESPCGWGTVVTTGETDAGAKVLSFSGSSLFLFLPRSG